MEFLLIYYYLVCLTVERFVPAAPLHSSSSRFDLAPLFFFLLFFFLVLVSISD
jgi:uncharacterized membrane protein YjdF